MTAHLRLALVIAVILALVVACGPEKGDQDSELGDVLVELGAEPSYAACLDAELPSADPTVVARIVEANSGGGYPALVDGVSDDELDAFLIAHRSCSSDP